MMQLNCLCGLRMNSRIDKSQIWNDLDLVHSIWAAPGRILPWTGTRSSSDWRRPGFSRFRFETLRLDFSESKERNAQIWAPESDDEEDEEEANKNRKELVFVPAGYPSSAFKCYFPLLSISWSGNFRSWMEAQPLWQEILKSSRSLESHISPNTLFVNTNLLVWEPPRFWLGHHPHFFMLACESQATWHEAGLIRVICTSH